MSDTLQTAFDFVRDPLEPRVMPQDGGAWFTVNRLIPSKRLRDGSTGPGMVQDIYPLRKYADVVSATAGSIDLYVSQGAFRERLRRSVHLAWATHAYVDLDTYRDDDLRLLTPPEMVNELLWYGADHDIPPPSVILFSGHGFYAKWFWSQPIPHAEVGRAHAINRSLVRRLARFRADPAAVDMARVLRIRDTINGKTGRPVEIVHLANSDTAPLTYDFDAFARAILPIVSAEYPDGVLHGGIAQAPKETPSGSRLKLFNRESWHWGVLVDLRKLAALRYPDGIVLEGMRDLFGHLAACQLARVIPAHALYREIEATARIFLPSGYVDRALRTHCSTLLHRATRAAKGEKVTFCNGERTPVYTYSKARMMELLRIIPDEERQMIRLISDEEHRRRQTESRRSRGIIDRATYEAPAAERRYRVAEMRGQGFGGRAIADALGISEGEVRRLSNYATNA